MFTEMVKTLAAGHLPDLSLLRGRLHAAMVKKLALVQQPPTYWETDPKRNPKVEHLFWGAVLLEDQEMLDTVKTIILVEMSEGKRHNPDTFVDTTLSGLLSLSSDQNLMFLLQEKIKGLNCKL